MTDPASGFASRLRGRWLWPSAIAALLVFGLYYPAGMLIVHKIDDNLDYQVADAAMPQGGSRAVAMAAALVDREIRQTGWVANDPFFLPGSMLDNMPNYQLGMIHALGRFAFEMVDQLGRTRGSSQTDGDLQEAAGLLQYSGTKWLFDFSTSLLPTAKSETQYDKAVRSLRRYNERLAAGNAIFERRADNLISTLDRIALDVGSASAAIDQRIHEGSGLWIDTQSDDVFYSVKGQAYAYYMVLRELRSDFGNIIRDKELGPTWDQMMASFAAAADLRPLIVHNARPDAMILPNHLASMGFYMLRARTQIREVSNILLK
ncbi:DUF2333 family protein [Ferrovibrio sp.]|uniref:DUF2333 family protein n=1 Tax=Ferrovibrio sp. TaxID=1917215 RepID=UPI00311D98C4